MATPERFISVQDVAKWLGVSEETVRRYIRDMSLTAFKPKGIYLIRASEVERFLESGRVQQEDKPKD